MAKSKNVHVVPHGDVWATKREGASRAGRVVNTQREAIEHAREMAISENGEVLIHRPNGQIRERDSYGNDPHPPKG